ncbi:MAG: hypothetical protein KatS3mg085_513 [Candidatus Dojkabacteria bacterium]|nr:MAG: hypothetical protein KatS3mg085_513 [Candidatus Dojkabacteria bacterium]
MEHVGHLPIIATKIYPFLDDSSVDIGKTLTMLAIHDIGELVTGDTFTYLKSDDDSQEEYEHALKLLDPVYHPFYEDVENQKSNSGKFAKSIDKMAPDLWELSLEPKESITRYQNKLGIKPKEIISLKKKSKMKYMEWNPFLSEFYEFILQNLEKHFFNK